MTTFKKQLTDIAKKLNLCRQETRNNEGFENNLSDLMDLIGREVFTTVFNEIEYSSVSLLVIENTIRNLTVALFIMQLDASHSCDAMRGEFETQFWPEFISTLDDHMRQGLKEFRGNKKCSH